LHSYQTDKSRSDTYKISTTVCFGGSAPGMGQALQKTNTFCDSNERETLLNHIQSIKCAWHGSCGEAEITFLCLVSNDSQLKRFGGSANANSKIDIN